MQGVYEHDTFGHFRIQFNILQMFTFLNWFTKFHLHYLVVKTTLYDFLFCCRSLVSWHPVLLSKSGAQYTWSFCDSQTNDIDIQYCCNLPKWLLHALSLSFYVSLYHRLISLSLHCLFLSSPRHCFSSGLSCFKSSNSGLSKQTLILISRSWIMLW